MDGDFYWGRVFGRVLSSFTHKAIFCCPLCLVLIFFEYIMGFCLLTSTYNLIERLRGESSILKVSTCLLSESPLSQYEYELERADDVDAY